MLNIEIPLCLSVSSTVPQAIAAEELARAAGNEGMDEDEANIKYEITRKHFEEGLAGTIARNFITTNYPTSRRGRTAFSELINIVKKATSRAAKHLIQSLWHRELSVCRGSKKRVADRSIQV